MMKDRPKLLLSLLFIMMTTTIWAQQGIVRAFVADELGKPLNYFNVIIRNLPDSTYVRGETGLNGALEMQHNFVGHKLVEISSLGYEDYSYIKDFSATAAVADTVIMREKSVQMDAIVVSASIPQVSTKQGKTIVRVAGSSLQHMPEVTDILRRAPGLWVENRGISVFGKGSPQIFIDGREVSYAELQLLQPQQILTIEVDRNPSARYDASYSSVVRVRTNRVQSQTSGQIASHSYQGRRYSNSTVGQLQVAGKRWVNYFSYSYADQTTRNLSTDTEAIHLPESPLTDTIFSNQLSRSRSHSVLYGSTFDINDRHQLSWQYNGMFSKRKVIDRQQEQLLQQRGLQNINAEENGDSRRASHSANLRYLFAVDSVRTIEITADYAHSLPRGSSTIARHYLELGSDDMVALRNRSTADVFSAKAEYHTPLWGADLLVGLRYGHIDSRTTSIYNINNTVTDLLNDNLAAYTTLGKEYTKWGWSAGLRGEFLNDDIRVAGATLRDGWENNLFPSFGLYTSELSKAIDLSLSYTSRIERPSVGQLNPAASYINSVVMGYGNPLLRSTISHNLEFGLVLWRNLSLTFGANFDINPSIEAGELSEDGQSIAFKPLNIARSRSYLVDVAYNNSWSVFSMTLNGGVEFPHAQIPYLGETINVGKPSWYISVNTDLRLTKNTLLTAGFSYYGRNYYLMTLSEPSNNLTVGITQYMFNRRLQLSIYGYDLLYESRPDWRDRFGFYETSQHSSFDTRRVRFSIRWLFNNHKSRYRERGRSEEYERID